MKRILLGILGIILLFWPFFNQSVLTGGDWSYVFSHTSDQFPLIPSVYRSFIGWGQNTLAVGGIEQYFQFTSHIFSSIPWYITERIFWLFPFLILGILSGYLLTKSLLGSLMYTTNTYILMLLGGGQMGIVLAYAIAPLVLVALRRVLSVPGKYINILLLGLVLSVNLFFDLRIFYIISIGVVIYTLFCIKYKKNYIIHSVISIGIAYLIAILVNSFWILPLISSSHSAASGYLQNTKIDALAYLSFARFSDSFALLHPNWPENIFGKTYFMRPEFLVIPLLAFGSLFFTSSTEIKKNKNELLFFAFIGILGAFLAKGIHDPFGIIYTWLFSHFPGWIMFRDPTKFYLLIGISYTFLIPFTLRILREKTKNLSFLYVKNNWIYISFIFFWIVLCAPLWQGKLTGNFIPRKIPQEYKELYTFLDNQKQFFRVMWIPQKDIFGYYSQNHPYIDAQASYHVSSTQEVVKKLKEEDLQAWGVKYIIIPSDTEGHLFVHERKYSEAERQRLIQEMDTIPWLTNVPLSTTKNIVYEVSSPHDIFFNNEHITISWKLLHPTQYQLHIKTQTSYTLIFSMMYDPNWKLIIGKDTVEGKLADHMITKFLVNKVGTYDMQLVYTPQKYMILGLWISTITLIIVIGFGVYQWGKNR